MGARALLQEMLALVRAQADAVAAGDHQAVADGAARHEALLATLSKAEPDGSPDELRAIVSEIDRAKAKLSRLLQGEAERVEFLLRLVLGGATVKPVGYPTGHWQPTGAVGRLNRRT